MARFVHYNLRECTCIAVGIPLDDGPDTDSFLKFTFPDDWEIDEGADGLLARCRTNLTKVMIDITFKGYSTDIDKLDAVRRADLLAGGGAGVGRVFLKDNNGTTNIASARHFILKAPDLQFGTKRGPVTFNTVAQMDAGSYIIGGNSVT